MSRLRANQITNENANGAPNFPHGLTVTGVVTTTTLNANVTGDLSVTGNIGVGGTLTYEDVKNVDSVGLITARTGIKIGPAAGVAGTFFADGSYITAGIITATTFHGSGANLTGIDATKIQTGTTTVETTTSRIDAKIGNVGVLTVTASGAKVTGIVTVFGQGIDYKWQGGTATAWWKNEDMVSTSSWPAAKGGTDANFISGNGGTNGLTYNSTDATFGGKKSMEMSGGGSGSLRTSNEDQNQWWNGTEGFTVIMALRKDGHGSGSSLGDSFWAFNYNTASSGSNVGGWGLGPFGDHTWGGQYGELFGYTGSQFEGQFTMFSYPWNGLFMVRARTNFQYCELSVNGGHGWHPLELRHGAPSSLPNNNYRSLSILNNACENSSSHNAQGRVAECAYWRNKRLGGADLEAVTRDWCNKFNL